MKFIYTDSANKELSKINERLKRDLEESVKKEKYVFGDDDLEITGSDVKNFFHVNRRFHKTTSKLAIVKLVASLYMLMGMVMVIGGAYYDLLLRMVAERPQQLVIVVSGLAITLLGFWGILYLKKREKDLELSLLRKSSLNRNSVHIGKFDSDAFFNGEISAEELKEIKELQDFIANKYHMKGSGHGTGHRHIILDDSDEIKND